MISNRVGRMEMREVRRIDQKHMAGKFALSRGKSKA